MAFNLRVAADGTATVGGSDVKVTLPKHISQKPSGIFVPSLRWVSKSRRTAVIERPPMRMQVHYASQMKSQALANGGKDSRLYSIPLPWTQYRIQLDHSGSAIATIAYSISPASIKSPNDEVYYIPLPNTSGGTRVHGDKNRTELTWICAPSSRPNVSKMPLGDSIVAGINSLWLSGFNNNAGSYPLQAFKAELPKKYKHLSEHGAWQPYLANLEKLSLREMIEITPYLQHSCQFGQLLYDIPTSPGRDVKSFINACYV